MDMRALRAPVIKFSIDGGRSIFFSGFAAASRVWRSRISIRLVLSGRETENGVVGGGSNRQVRRRVCRP
jgi:hypothetical protein